MELNDLTYIIRGAIFKVHSTLGPGLLESIYESAFVYELNKRAIPYTRQQEIPVYYDNCLLDIGFRADIIMENKLLILYK